MPISTQQQQESSPQHKDSQKNLHYGNNANFEKHYQNQHHQNSGSDGNTSSAGSSMWKWFLVLGVASGVAAYSMQQYAPNQYRDITHLVGNVDPNKKYQQQQRANVGQHKQSSFQEERNMAKLLNEGAHAEKERVPKMRENANSNEKQLSTAVVKEQQHDKGLLADSEKRQITQRDNAAPGNTTTNDNKDIQAAVIPSSASTQTAPINHSYHNLLEKKQNLLTELESELDHLRSFLIKTELYTQKRERQFDELESELHHVRSYLLNKETHFSLKDQEIDSLKNSLSTVQRKMESAIEQIKDEHKQKEKELEEVHRAELMEVESTIDVMLEDQRKILEQEYLKQNQGRIEKLRELTEKVYAVEESFHRSSSYLINSVRLQKMTAAVLALQQVLKTDAPFFPEMRILAEEGYGDRLIEEMVYAIPKEVQREGLKRTHQLYVDFCNLDRKALEASYIPSTAGFFGLLYSKIVGQFLIQERGLVDGDSVDAKLARARVYLANQQLSLAVSELSEITGEARDVLQPWMSQAENRLIADQSMEILHAHITNLSASLVE
eukprot:CAMPEP_0117442542 /NCGR_PEP_ID=MMETSP0759-20121206/4207_1 /TAXON_ID=63605 /ORGANISM="Percolomonas cosmopolitus, Strain WS" /LENGTH=551 /DNA_ID=CAMNT_0005234437 /DNA_START=171 /DNA_END=1827 /DNA_ORIENTATION=+